MRMTISTFSCNRGKFIKIVIIQEKIVAVTFLIQIVIVVAATLF